MNTVLFWFRHDLRLHDQSALHAACANCAADAVSVLGELYGAGQRSVAYASGNPVLTVCMAEDVVSVLDRLAAPPFALGYDDVAQCEALAMACERGKSAVVRTLLAPPWNQNTAAVCDLARARVQSAQKIDTVRAALSCLPVHADTQHDAAARALPQCLLLCGGDTHAATGDGVPVVVPPWTLDLDVEDTRIALAACELLANLYHDAPPAPGERLCLGAVVSAACVTDVLALLRGRTTADLLPGPPTTVFCAYVQRVHTAEFLGATELLPGLYVEFARRFAANAALDDVRAMFTATTSEPHHKRRRRKRH